MSNSTLSFWRTQLHDLDNHRTTEILPTVSDIVVIGAGYAGASTVHHILEKSKGKSTKPSIVILEAREACSGATGRNGGHLKPDPYIRPDTIVSEHGLELAKEASAFEAEHVTAIKELVEREKIDCDLVITRAIDVQLTTGVRDNLKAGYDRLVSDGVESAKHVSYSSPKIAEGISGVKGAKGCFSYTAGHIWPYKLVLHLLSKAVSQGVNLQTHTPVSGVSPTRDSSGQWTVSTSRGDIKAKYVVFASNGYTSNILPEYKDKIVPVRGVASRIVVPNGSAPYLSNSYIIRQNNSEYDYLIPRADGSIIVGGARSSYMRDLNSWYNTTDDSKILDSSKKYFDGYMQRTFRGWENSGAYTDKVWTGIMGYSTDHLPHIGAIPSKENQFIIAGFTGHGMPQVFLSARGIASMIVDGKSFEDSGVPRVYKTTQARLDSKRNKILEDHAKMMRNGSEEVLNSRL